MHLNDRVSLIDWRKIRENKYLKHANRQILIIRAPMDRSPQELSLDKKNSERMSSGHSVAQNVIARIRRLPGTFPEKPDSFGGTSFHVIKQAVRVQNGPFEGPMRSINAPAAS